MNKPRKQDNDTQNEFIGEIVNIMDDGIIEVEDESGQIYSFKITDLEVPNEFEELDEFDEFEEEEVLEIGDRVKVTIEKGQATSIQKA